METLQNLDTLIAEYGDSIVMPWADESSVPSFGGMRPLGRRMSFNGTFTQPASLDVDYGGISSTFAKVGLACPDNNTSNIRANLRTLVQGFAPGTFHDTFVKGGVVSFGPGGSAPSTPKPYQWTVDGMNELKSLLDIIMANIEKVKKDNLYYTASNRVENSFRSTTIGSIVNVFKAAGSIIGSVQGNNINPEQLGAQIGDILLNLTETTSSDFDQRNQSNITLVADPSTDKDGNATMKAVASVAWTYHFKVGDYKDKKVSEKSSYYLITQNNVIFTDANILEKVATKLI